MIRVMRIWFMFLQKQKASYIFLFIMLTLALWAYLFAACQINYSISALQYFQNLKIDKGYYIEAQSQEKSIAIFYDELIRTKGIDSLIYRKMPYIKPSPIEAVDGAEFQIFTNALEKRKIVVTKPSLNELKEYIVIKDQILVIVPASSSFDIGETRDVSLKSGEKKTIVAVAEYADEEFFLAFDSGGSSVSYQGLTGNSKPVFLWRDSSGDCTDNPQYAAIDGFLAYVVFSENSSLIFQQDLKAWLVSKGVIVHDRTEMSSVSLQQINQLLKSTFAFPCFLLIVSAMMIINTSVLRIRKSWNRIAICRLVGLPKKWCILGNNIGVLVIGLLSWLIMLISGFLLNYFRPEFLFQRNLALINNNLYFTALVILSAIISLTGIISWALLGRISLSGMLRRKE